MLTNKQSEFDHAGGPKLSWFCLVALLCSCSVLPEQSATHEYLDRRTGLTITALSEPLIFARSDRRVSTNLRDYLYAGPIEVNRMGTRSYYLWIAPFSTIDRPKISVVGYSLRLADTIIQLPEPAIDNRLNKLAELPYSLPLENQNASYIPISADVIKQIAATNTLIMAVDTGSTTESFMIWRGDVNNIQKFADAVRIK